MNARTAWDRAVAALREHYFLGTARTRAVGIDAAMRERAATLRIASRQKHEAAELLLIQGSSAEALQLATESVARMREAFATLEAAGIFPPAGVARALARAQRRVDAFSPLPPLDAAVPPKHIDSATALLRAQYRLDSWLSVSSLDVRGLRRLSVWRLLRSAVYAFVAIAVVAIAFSYSRAVGATASSELSPLFSAARALDGDPNTDWVAAKDAPEWLMLQFRGKRRIKGVTLLNGHIVAHHGTNAFRVAVYDHGREVASAEGTFPAAPAAASVSLPLNGAKGDRVVITIVSHYGDGAAISEVTLF